MIERDARRPLLLLNQFDLVTVRILDESDRDRAMLHRTRLADYFDAAGFQVGATLVDVVNGERDVPVRGADFVLGSSPVPGQLDHGILILAAVADEGQGKFAAGE